MAAHLAYLTMMGSSTAVNLAGMMAVTLASQRPKDSQKADYWDQNWLMETQKVLMMDDQRHLESHWALSLAGMTDCCWAYWTRRGA